VIFHTSISAHAYSIPFAIWLGAALVSEMVLGATAWVEGNEYVVEKTIKQLAIEREGNR